MFNILLKFMIKKRKGDENIGKLIVFAVTIIIAVSFIGLSIYFYNVKTYEKKVVRALGDIGTTIKTLNYLGICSGATEAKISYTPIKNVYILHCNKKVGVNLNDYPDVFIISGCISSDNYCIYKLLSK